MDSKPFPVRFTLGKQSSLAPEHGGRDEIAGDDSVEEEREIDPTVRLMYLAHEGDLEGIKELLESGTDVNFRDIDGRTALHVAACQGFGDVVELLLKNGAEVDPEDRWGSRPLADAIHYKNHDVIKLLEKHGAKPLMAPMHVKNARQVPEYEIDPKELDFTNSVQITKGTFSIAFWQGTKVAVKRLGEEVTADEDKVTAFRDELELLQKIRHPNVVQFLGAVTQSTPMMIVTEYLPKGTFSIAFWQGTKVAVKRLGKEVTADENKVTAFRDELELLQKIRHPNVVQFLGAVTQSTPMMIVTEYLPKGDLGDFLKRKGALRTTTAVRFALDIARGMNYLHENRPDAIIHRDLEPSNILRDDSGHLKVADFGVSKMLKVTSRVKEDRPLTYQDSSCRYVAPEVFRNEEYDTKVDVFSFALILQEMIEGRPPFYEKEENEVAKAYAAKVRPPFRAPRKSYPHGLKELIEECWSENPTKRPTFRHILDRLENIYSSMARKRHWKVRTLKCFPNLEAMWKKDLGSLSSRSRSSRSTNNT
ncbi:Serine/threonine-protein kinase [Actinidia chinensis var. chinensis]|uniref:non-specific serine/threonine protein kinase n=1 Tax=Actinidia chinensis var. chinensis TaxID=1590841 RepID=A0A2R6QAE4_ACTCC|nr:Serine/threonine-protein kinase [Actinidia chinensis var. chinensis]